MKKQTKTIILSIAICMIFALGVFCIFAVQNFSLSSNGIIEFVAPGIDATISQATLSGISKKEGFGQMQEFTITPEMTESQISNLPGVKSWSNIGLVFDEDSGGRASLSFTITNNSSKEIENIMVELSTNTTHESPIHATPSADFCIEPKSSHTFTIDIAVADLQNTISFKGFKLVVDLRIIKPSQVLLATEQKEENGLTLTTNSKSQTAVLTKAAAGLTSIEIPAVVKGSDGKLYTVTEIKDSLTQSDSAFWSSHSTLTSVILPNTLTKIGGFAFYSCSLLEGPLTLPQGLTSIGKSCFSGCTRFSGDFIIPNNVTTIGSGAFLNCGANIGELILGSGLNSLEEGAFQGKAITSIKVDPTNQSLYVKGNCLISKQDKILLLGCNSSVIPQDEGITQIGRNAFDGCEGLTGTLTIPSTVTIIDYCAFKFCKGITKLILPEGVQSFGQEAFSYCSGITGDLVIPNSVTYIGHYAFSSCSKLTSVTIGSGVTEIWGNVFSSCRNLLSLTIFATTPPELRSGLLSFVDNCKIYVPAESVDLYKAAENWSTYSSRIEAIS